MPANLAVSPFRGVLYNPRRISKMEEVVAPPYDVISPEERKRLAGRHPYNVIHLILPRGKRPYQKAALTFRAWLKSGVLVQNGQASLYLYHQTFRIGKRKILRKGLLALRRLEPWGRSVFPHEKTLSAPKRDRLRLLRECQANLSPVFSLYSDPRKKVDQLLKKIVRGKPLFNLRTDDGIHHQFWSISDPAVVRSVCFFLSGRRLTIADGHHRYETALAYSRERRKMKRGNRLPGSRSVMMFFSNIDDPGLVVLPTHRLYHSPLSWDWEKIQKKTAGIFKVRFFPLKKKMEFLKSLEKTKKMALGVVLPQSPLILFETDYSRLVRSSLAKGLDPQRLVMGTTLLHELFLPRVVGIAQDKNSIEKDFAFEKEGRSVIRKVTQGTADAGFLLSPPCIKDVVALSESGKRLSQKTTFFYPKLLSGLVFHKF